MKLQKNQIQYSKQNNFRYTNTKTEDSQFLKLCVRIRHIDLRIVCLTLPRQKEKERKTICSCKEEVNYRPKRLTLNEEHPLEEGIKLREDVNLLSLKRRS